MHLKYGVKVRIHFYFDSRATQEFDFEKFKEFSKS